MPPDPAAQRHFLISVDGVEGNFATKSGGETSADTTAVWDGGAITPERLASPAETANVTVSRPFRPERDRAIIRRLRPLVGILRTAVTVQDLTGEMVAVGDPTVYANALLVRIADPEADAGSGDPARFELEFAIETVA